MDINRFTEKSQEAIRAAQSLAARLSHQQIEPEHLTVALLEQENGLVPNLLLKAGVVLEPLHKRLLEALERQPKVQVSQGGGDQIYISGRLERVLANAEQEARKRKDDFVSVEHILLALLADTGTAGQAFREAGANRAKMDAAVTDVRGSQRVTSQNPEATYQSLERYGRDLTQLAAQGKLDPVIGRDDEIRRVIQVLSRRTKNNPVLIG
ncbi:MAG: type VI secretion system ATPase TssH, partial [Bryobacterales bacterium]|nr:type VI secretion system ATPase TssH [Bryobacterales bacterium]